MALPRKLKLMNLFNDGRDYMGDCLVHYPAKTDP